MSGYPLLDLFLTMLWFFLWVLWLVLLFRVFGDLFRDDELSGWAKTGWTIFVCVLPFLGVLIYLIARGRGMGDREYQRARQRDQAFRAYVRDAAADVPRPNGSGDGALARLTRLRDHGDLTEEEYQRARAKLVAI
ncbi:SHOCT domain-containing protein [Amycolatopsis acidiphila]|uniref:SHOCT domain-containing protein n=1 Tax=Amycolatopsis acidiphila TaxID=715473 RepID=A0A558ANS5_9PSEU|nr:SHOCT domain-containing protein [Amycolatopsis acidiphila]TVT25898.1 SHOCT domain-containing protein [Amycolatopsis acidiphila]UIJ63401.1 SHOCT domain-containing protein [Amycolatopsis acidiphila]GHG75412.1 hypothetical protein GCM10017788_40300 [Amycolatopsis acidiphila]